MPSALRSSKMRMPAPLLRMAEMMTFMMSGHRRARRTTRGDALRGRSGGLFGLPAELGYDAARAVGAGIDVDVDHRCISKLTHVTVLRFDDDAVFFEGDGSLLIHQFKIVRRIGMRRAGHGPEVMRGGFRLRRDAVEAAHVETAAIRIFQRFCADVDRT